MATTPITTAAAVPLALWLLPSAPSPAGDHDRLLAATRRTLTEFGTPPCRIAVVTTRPAVAAALHDHLPAIDTIDPGRLRALDVSHPLDLLVLDNPRPGTVRAARRAVNEKGMVVALSAATRRAARWHDPLPELIAAAGATGLRYQQHILAVDDPTQDTAELLTARRPVTGAVPIARRTHVDVLVLTASKETR